MKTNFSQAKSWINSAFNDTKRMLNDLKLQDFSRVAFTSQFAVEKLNKALLSFLGIKVEKTHNPSEILKMVLDDEEAISVDKKTEGLIENIIRNSEFFEKQGTKTRYGIIINDKLKFPEEIYRTFDDIKDFITNLIYIINDYVTIIKDSLKLANEEFDMIQKLEELKEELKKWI